MSNEKSGALALVPRTESTALGVSGGVRIEGMAEVFKVAEALAKARGFVPDTYADRPSAIAACILTGMELGIPPMTAMREIHIIKGRPTISATMMLTLAQRAGVKTRWIETTDKVATIGVTVLGVPEQKLSFTIDEAKAAGLLSNDNWKKYPAAMLRARATSAAIRAFCPSVIGGSVYESESGELTDGVSSAAVQAQVTDMTPPPARPQAPTPAPRKRLRDVTTGDDLHAWCVAEHDRMTATRDEARAEAVNAVRARAVACEVDPAVALEWAGLHFDPSSGEVAEAPDAQQ